MRKFFKSTLLGLLIIFTTPAYSNNIFSFHTCKNQVLNYHQTKSLSLLNHLISQTIESPQKINYTIEYNTTNSQSEELILSKSKIIFNNSPTKVLHNKKYFKLITEKLLTDALIKNKKQKTNRKLNWIIAALHRRFRHFTDHEYIPLKGSYPITHYMIMNNIILEPKFIIETQLYTSSGFKYEIYAELCDILLRDLQKQKNGKKIIANYIKNSINSNNQTAINTLYQSLSQTQKTDQQIKLLKKKLRIELNKTARDYSVNTFMPANTKYSIKIFNKLNIIKYKPKDNPNSLKICYLKNIVNNINSMNTPINVLRRTIIKINHAQIMFPYFMKKPAINISNDLEKLITAIKNNTQINKHKIQKSINNSIDSLFIGVKKQKALNKTMLICEIKNLNTFNRFKRHFKIINKNENYNKDLWPELNKYLDTQNKQYTN
jgi:hypothetical protein